ncbi:MAG TPA: ThiF family adenylyltransferase, partial [Burkholderiaceae bacterium]|nr:ThiF family adenylyltransferase [Burkholderiaceae bacterium]
METTAAAGNAATSAAAADLDRRFGGVRRLYGGAGYERLRTAHVAVVGLGGVGSWAVEALARSGVGALTLIDLDHVAESNINRQLQALDATLGQAKPLALRDRIAQIHPQCEVRVVEAFVEPGNWPALLQGRPIDGVIDACDQVRAKQAIAQWSLATGVPIVCAGAAGGKRAAQRVELADLADVTHDPLLAALRQRLRKVGAPRSGAIGVRCVFSRETVARPDAATCDADAPPVDGSLNCHGYGSSVAVTATFG